MNKEPKTIIRSRICGISCKPGHETCNGYCTTASIKAPGTYELGLMDLGGAIADLQAGHCVQRIGWVSAKFVFLRPGDTLPRPLLANVKTLPPSAKALLMALGRDVEFLPCFCLMNERGQVVNGWMFDQADAQAKDWVRVSAPSAGVARPDGA